MSTKQTLVVIGNGMVGQNFLASLVASPVKEDYEIVTFAKNPELLMTGSISLHFLPGKPPKTCLWLNPAFSRNMASPYI